MKQRKKTNARRPETREAILEAAFETFSQYGYDGTTTRGICDRAGVNVSTLHYYYGDKEQLWLAACDLYHRRIREIIRESADFTAPPEEALPQFLGAVFDAFAQRPELLRINLWITLESEWLDYEKTRDHLDPLVETGAAYLEKCQEAGMVKDIDVYAVLTLVSAQLIYSLAQGRAHSHLFGTGLSDPEFRAMLKKGFMKSALTLIGLDED